MRGLLTNTLIGLLTIGMPSARCSALPPTDLSPAERVHAFYYGWYGTPEVNGQWLQWNHAVLLLGGKTGPNCQPPEDIGANFYPEAGPYSSRDAGTVARHCAELQRAGVGVVAVSWWGKDHVTDQSLPVLFDAARASGLKIAFHLEPWPGRDAASIRDALAYLLERWGSAPELFRWVGRPLVYVYDSYLVPDSEWKRLLRPDGDISVRGTPQDCVFIGLWVKEDHGRALAESGFDGFYTYFATEGFTWGSTPGNWPKMARFARRQGKMFIPSVGPGYNDLRIRPWNRKNYRARDGGAYYDAMMRQAVDVDPQILSITSYNEWHEGTQIEPAVPKQAAGRDYEDYGNLAPTWYLDRTRYWVDRWLHGSKGL